MNTNKILGTVLGAAVGDAMGHPTEFLTMDQIRTIYGPSGVRGFEIYWDDGRDRFAPYTDDTQMAEIVLRSLVQACGQSIDRTMKLIADRFVNWMRYPQGGHRSPGNTCLDGCRNLARGEPWESAGVENGGGCGSVMRAYPFGLVFVHDMDKAIEWAAQHSKLTHRADIALAASAAMAHGVALCLQDYPVGAVIESMIGTARRWSSETADMMHLAQAEAIAGIKPEVTLDRLRGWAAHEAIAAAVYVLARHADDSATAILEAANTPGDSDSIATLVGALVGARNGINGLPERWVDEVERSWELRNLAHQVGAVWSGSN